MRTALILLAACHSSANLLPTDGNGSASGSDAMTSMPDASACGLRSGMRGKTSRTLHVAGLDRTYIVYLPEIASTDPVPLVFVHHGYTMSGQNMYDITGYPALADREHIAVAFPDGQGGPSNLTAPWNVGDNVCPADGVQPPVATGDDFAFLAAMKADIAQDQCIDNAHVFVTGFSMGGYFAHHAGCEGAGLAGVAPHSGGTHDLTACANAKMPIIMFHGAADPLVPAGCDDPNAIQPLTEGAAAARWAAHNGCATTTTTHAVENGTCASYDGCPVGGQVELCTFNAMGHCWAGGDGVNVYSCGNYESATELEWAFWKQYAF